MVSIITLAFVLLCIRIGSDIFIYKVLRRQWALMKLPINYELINFRKLLFGLSVAIFVGNIIPIIIDAATLFVDTSRPPQVKPLSVAYAFSNACTSFISAFLIWSLYRQAADIRINQDELNEKNHL